MIETEELVRMMAATVRQLVADQSIFFTSVKSLGRKLKDGQIQIIGTEDYAGPDGGKAPYAYVRYRDGAREHSFQHVKGTTAEGAIEVRAHLRFVALHKCRNEGALQSSILAALMASASKNDFAWRVTLLNSSGRGQTVQREETQGDTKEPEGTLAQDFLGEANLIAVDFDLTYTIGAGESACAFTCDACC